MKQTFLIPLLTWGLGLAAAPALAQEYPEFSEADTDKDGVLSTEEAKQALPELQIVDIDNDGLLSRTEAENALPGLMFSTGGEEPGPVGAAEYRLIVEKIGELAQGSQDG